MLNKIILQGRLTKDLELRYTQSNTAVTSGTLAVQRSRKDTGGKYPSDFIDFCGGKSEGKPKEEESDFIASEESDFIMSDESDPDDCPFL